MPAWVDLRGNRSRIGRAGGNARAHAAAAMHSSHRCKQALQVCRAEPPGNSTHARLSCKIEESDRMNCERARAAPRASRSAHRAAARIAVD